VFALKFYCTGVAQGRRTSRLKLVGKGWRKNIARILSSKDNREEYGITGEV